MHLSRRDEWKNKATLAAVMVNLLELFNATRILVMSQVPEVHYHCSRGSDTADMFSVPRGLTCLTPHYFFPPLSWLKHCLHPQNSQETRDCPPHCWLLDTGQKLVIPGYFPLKSWDQQQSPQ